MSLQLSDKLVQVPHSPGVYTFTARDGRVLYVGKAKDLRARLRHYFQPSGNLDPRKRSMVAQAADFSTLQTDTELEALALEATLIKQHRPKFNVLLRDDKNYPYLKITMREEWPRVEVTRRVTRDGSLYFGPYVPAGAMWEALDLIRKNFQIRPCRYNLTNQMRPCIEHQMGHCPAPCAGKVSREDYRKSVDEVVLFLKGKNKVLVEELRAKMHKLSEELRYEEAAALRDRLRRLELAWQSQKVLSPELGDLDVIALYNPAQNQEDAPDKKSASEDVMAQVFFVRSGTLLGARHFLLKHAGPIPYGELMHEFLVGLYSTENVEPPTEVVLEAEPEDAEVLTAWLKKKNPSARLSWPSRGKRHELLDMARENARTAMAARKSAEASYEYTIEELAERLSLGSVPRTIGAFDISNLTGTDPVGGFVLWQDGEFKPEAYRHVRIRGVQGIDDYAMMQEAITRVFEGMEPRPDLTVIDGGKGHLQSAAEALGRLPHKQTPLVSVAKKPDRVFSLDTDEPLDISGREPSSLLLRRIRDEVHRFAVSFHTKLRGKRLLRSPLEAVAGIGKKRRLALLRQFGSLEAMREATIEELAKVPGMNALAAAALHKALAAEDVAEEEVKG